MNAINNVHRLKSCISLNKRFWAKSFFANLQKSFCRIHLKIKIPTNWLGRLTYFFFLSISQKLFPKTSFEKKDFWSFFTAEILYILTFTVSRPSQLVGILIFRSMRQKFFVNSQKTISPRNAYLRIYSFKKDHLADSVHL